MGLSGSPRQTKFVKGWPPRYQLAVVVCLLAVASGCATPAGPSPVPGALSSEGRAFADALAHFSRGISYEWEREPDAAFTNFQQAAELDLDNEELQFRVALGLLQRRRPDDAVVLMDRLARRHPDSERAQLWAAFVYRAVDKTDKALAAYERAIRTAPASPIAYVEKASLYAKLNRVDDAMRLLEHALDRVDDPKELLHALGEIYVRQATVIVATGSPTKRMKSALRIFERAAAKAPDDRALLLQLSDLYVLNGEYEKAVQCLERIEAEHPDDLRLRQKLAMSLLAGRDRRKAIDALERLLAQSPDDAHLLYYLGQIYEQNGDRDQAIHAYERVIDVAPRDPAAYLRLSMLEIASDQAEQAMQTLTKGLEQLPSDARFLELLAYIHLGRREYDRALEYFAKTEGLLEKTGDEPITPNFQLNYAIATQLAGKTGEAATLLYKAMDVNRAYLDAYVDYVFRAPGQTNLVDSVNVLTKLSEKAPDNASVFLYIGLLNSYAKRYPAAIRAFEKTEKLAADANEEEDVLTPSFFFWYGSACERNGEFDRAVSLFQKCIAMEPDPEDRMEYKAYIDALNYVAYMWAERGEELDDALDYVKRAIEARPKSAAYIDTLGWVYFMQGHYDEAEKEITRALDLLPEDPTITDHMGDIQAKLGHDDDAITWWKKSFVLDPTEQKVADKLTAHGVDLAPLRVEAEDRQKKEAEAAEHAPSPILDDLQMDRPEQPEDEEVPELHLGPDLAPVE